MIGEKLGERYEIVGEIGRGGMGVVFRARDPLLGREVAIKMLPSVRLQGQAEERFEREARLVAQLDHPAVVPVYDFGQHEGSLYYVMPILEGESLRTLIDRGSVSLGDVLDLTVQIAGGLDYSHVRGVVHRDIKPENVMVSEMEGLGLRARLMDFGLAVGLAGSRVTEAGSLMGTVSYFSPEQARGESVDGRSDLYSLGIVLYECLAGTTPFSGSLHTILYRTLHELPTGFRERGVEVDEELEAVVLDCLAKDPERRPARGADLAERLRRYRSTLGERETLKVGAPRTARREARVHAPVFVGRELELGELQRQLNASLRGECRFVVVGSDPGMGKTRLVEELDRLAVERRIRVLRGRFSDQGGSIPFQGFCDLVQDHFRNRDHHSTSSTGPPDLREVASDLIALFPVLSEIEEIREAAAGPASPVPPQPIEAGDRSTLHELLARTLARLGGGRPMVLVLENLHADESAIDALQYVVHRLGPTPTLVVATYRMTDLSRRHPLIRMVHGMADDPAFTSLRLGPLAPREHRALVESMMGEEQVTGELAGQLFESTEGNPFFTVELVRSLVDAGSISRGHTGAWSLVGERTIAPETLPLTIQEAVEKRLDRLPKAMRDVLAFSAVLGRTFDFEDLEHLVGETEEDLDEVVDRLLQEGLLEEDRRSRGDRLTFASGVVREVLYAGLSRRRKRSLHRRHARRLERRFAGRLARVYPRLVHHFAEGDLAEKTVEYAVQLAQQALAAFRPEDAVRATRTALEFVEDDEIEGADVLEGEIRLLLATALQALGDEDSARHEAIQACQVLERIGAGAEAARAALVAAESAWHERRVADARRWTEKGLRLARASDEKGALRRLLSLSATVSNLRGDYERARRDLEEMESLFAPAEGDRDPVPRGGVLRTAFATAPTTLDPAAARTLEDTEILANVYEPLLSVDAEGHWIPRLCAGWEESADGTLFRFVLRPEARFGDGHPVGPADVKASIERLVRWAGDELSAAWRTIRGLPEMARGEAEHIEGILVDDDDTVAFVLVEPLPFFPSLLTDINAAVVRETEDGDLVGTGPFALDRIDEDRIVLRARSDYWRGAGPNVDAVEFVASGGAAGILQKLREGSIDLGKDLPPRDLEVLLRDPRFEAGLSEAPKKNVYFLLFDSGPESAADPELRRALVGTLNVEDLVWRALGRFSQPASSLIPPGVSGHDPGRRRPHLPRSEAEQLLARRPRPIRLRAAVHPLLLDRYRALTDAIFASWAELGVEVEIATRSMEEYSLRRRHGEGADLLIGRWIPDYDDPDAMTAALFHSAHGMFRAFFASEEADALLEQARRERNRPLRQVLYRRFENLLAEDFVVVPLFHDVDYRISGPRVRGLRLTPDAPWVNYTELGASATDDELALPPSAGAGAVRAALPVAFDHLDPAGATIVEQAEVTSTFLETLTRADEQAQIRPLLAESWSFDESGRKLRLRLRSGVRFHDGRKLSARDVRWSFERLLTHPVPTAAGALLPIRGAREMRDGTSTELAGFRIVSPLELELELEEPLPFFPAMLTHPTTSIVPEGTREIAGTWRDGCPGTGPFRLVRFDPGSRVELDANPAYWRPGLPRAAGLEFELGLDPARVLTEFRSGRLSLASHLRPRDVEQLRRDRDVRGALVEAPGLSTYFLVLNCRRGPMSDVGVRRAFRAGLDTAGLVEKSLGKLALPAEGLIPPGLLGHDAMAASEGRRASAPGTGVLPSEPLRTWVHPVFTGHFQPFWKGLVGTLAASGVRFEESPGRLGELTEAIAAAEHDVYASRWLADYPDADSFVGFVHSLEGIWGPLCGEPEIDRAIERARRERDPGRRHVIYREIEKRLEDDVRVVALFHEQVIRIGAADTRGLRVRFSVPEVVWEEIAVGS